mmetsp:Transcript_66473/g.131791  ORF Transcript_66473/g.131791 Transcript_66473/m.131791 type:complete len:96 (+) Transcript_66473:20-307(+)
MAFGLGLALFVDVCYQELDATNLTIQIGVAETGLRGAQAHLCARCNPRLCGTVYVEHSKLTMDSCWWTVYFSCGSIKAPFCGMQSWDWSCWTASD